MLRTIRVCDDTTKKKKDVIAFWNKKSPIIDT